MDIEDKLACMTASRNALREEIQGLQLYINQLRKRLGEKQLFKNPKDNGYRIVRD